MKNINKDKFSDFENEWQKAFEDAEMEPGKDIWNNIDAKLANKETDKYKRRIIYYRWMTAASVVFAIGLSYFSLTYTSNNGAITEDNRTDLPVTDETAEAKRGINEHNGKSLPSDEKHQIEENTLARSENDRGAKFKSDNSGDYTTTEKLADNEKRTRKNEGLEDENTFSDDTQGDNDSKHAQLDKLANTTLSDEVNLAASSGDNELQTTEKSLESKELNSSSKGQDVFNENTHSPVLAGKLEDADVPASGSVDAGNNLNAMNGYSYYDMLYAELMEPPYIYSIPGIAIIREDKNTDSQAPKLWAGLNVGSSLFDPNFEEGSNFQPKASPALFQYATADGARVLPQEASFDESTDPGISYSLGVNFGLRLSEKWVIQSGIAYAHKSASTSSSTYIENVKNEVESPTNFGNVSTETDRNVLSSLTQDYQLSNSFQFASVPLKAGYLLVDRKIGVMVLAGVSADFFLSNTLSETDDKIAEVKVEAGSDSPFRDINFNGVIGAEFSYKLSRNYHLTLEPNYGVALSSFTKSGSSFTSNPQTFGISAGLKFYWK